MASTTEIKNGVVLKFNNDLFQITDFQHVKPGKGAAFVRTKLKSVTTGKVLENTFPSGAKIDIVRVETRKHQFLYKDDMGFHFMNNENFEQIAIEETMINAPGLLLEGQEVEIQFNTEDETPLTCELPAFVVLEIKYTEPGIKGDTATNTLKAAELETGANMQVPLFVDTGEKIKVDTRTNSYVERVK